MKKNVSVGLVNDDKYLYLKSAPMTNLHRQLYPAALLFGSMKRQKDKTLGIRFPMGMANASGAGKQIKDNKEGAGEGANGAPDEGLGQGFESVPVITPSEKGSLKSYDDE